MEDKELDNQELVEKLETVPCNGILEIMDDGYGFLRGKNYITGEKDIYVSHNLIRKFRLRTGDELTGRMREKNPGESAGAVTFIEFVNGSKIDFTGVRKKFENLTPIFPHKKIALESGKKDIINRVIDIFAPIGLGQRGIIVAPPRTGKTTILKEIATSVQKSKLNLTLIILLIDERPEEVTDIIDNVRGDNVEVIYSTFDESPEHHTSVAEMVLERSKRLVETGKDVVILLDSITRLARAYNLILPTSGRTLSGGLDPVSLYPPKKFFGAARCMREGGSLTILATALIDTGSKMDDVIFEEFKGTGNMELVLDRSLAEKHVYPAIDICKSGTRRDDLLLKKEEQDFSYAIKNKLSNQVYDKTEELIKIFKETKNNKELISITKL